MTRSAINLLGCLSDRDVDAWEDDQHEIVDGCVDVYTHDLTAWLASSLDRVGYLDDVVADGPSDSASALMRAQYAEIDEVFGLLVGALREQSDALDDDEEEETEEDARIIAALLAPRGAP